MGLVLIRVWVWVVLEKRLIRGNGGVSVVAFQWWAWTARLGFDFGSGGGRSGLGFVFENYGEFRLLVCVAPQV